MGLIQGGPREDDISHSVALCLLPLTMPTTSPYQNITFQSIGEVVANITETIEKKTNVCVIFFLMFFVIFLQYIYIHIWQ